jgi:hypothetical protein
LCMDSISVSLINCPSGSISFNKWQILKVEKGLASQLIQVLPCDWIFCSNPAKCYQPLLDGSTPVMKMHHDPNQFTLLSEPSHYLESVFTAVPLDNTDKNWSILHVCNTHIFELYFVLKCSQFPKIVPDL